MDGRANAHAGRGMLRTILTMALGAPLVGGLIVFLMALTIFGAEVPPGELFAVVMAFAFAAGVLPALIVGILVARADRRGQASFPLALAGGLVGGALFAAVLYVVNDGGLRPTLLAGAVGLAVLSVLVAWWCSRAMQARDRRLDADAA